MAKNKFKKAYDVIHNTFGEYNYKTNETYKKYKEEYIDKTEPIPFKISKSELRLMTEFISNSEYSNRSEFIRAAINEKINKTV